MGTEILRPQNCLIERIRVSPCRRKNYNYNYSHYNTNQQQQQSKYYNDYSNPTSNPNPRPNRKPAVRSDQRKRQSEPPFPASKRSSSADDFLKISRNHNNHHGGNNNNKGGAAGQNIVMEKVSILRRGESLDSKMKSMEMAAPANGYMVVTGTDRLGPGPEMVPKQVRIAEFRSPVAGKCDMYAGSGFAVSPAPSSLPLPSFSKKKQLAVDDSATRDLRRLLRLDF